jgi:hypothetical protein
MWAKKIQQFLEIAETLQKSIPLWRDNLGATLGEMAQIAKVALEPAFEQAWCTNHREAGQFLGSVDARAPLERSEGSTPKGVIP